MKKLLLLSFTLLLSSLAALSQKVQPIQIQVIDTSKYVVEYVPLATAQANVAKQLDAVNQELEKVDKQQVALQRRHDQLIVQKAALTAAQTQLDKAAAAPVTETQSAPAEPIGPPPATTPKKPKKKKQ